MKLDSSVSGRLITSLLLTDGSIERHKARVVAQGFAQRPGFDFTETFTPTPKWSALRAVLAIAAIEDLELESVDISSAYLNGMRAAMR